MKLPQKLRGRRDVVLDTMFFIYLPDMMQAALALRAPQPTLITNDKALIKVEELDVFLLDEML